MISLSKTQDPSGYVYCIVLKSGTFSSVKVGSTTNIHNRFTSLKNETGAGISNAHIWKADDCRVAEKRCHNAMTSTWKGMRAEWYKPKYHAKIISRIRKCMGKKEDWYFDDIKTDLREYRGFEAQELRQFALQLQDIERGRYDVNYYQDRLRDDFLDCLSDMKCKEDALKKLDQKQGALRSFEKEMELKYDRYIPKAVPTCSK